MAKRDSPIESDKGFSSTVRKVLEVDAFGKGAQLSVPITFAELTTGTVAVHNILTVTGTVAMSIFAKCTTDLVSAGGGTISVGTALTVDGLLPVTTGTDLDENDIWHDASPDASVELTSVLKDYIVSDDVNYKILVGAITAGVVEFYIRWAPISSDGNVVVA